MNKILHIIIFSFFLVSGCGFKVINQNNLTNFSIDEINTSGDKKISYDIKNKLLSLKNLENEKLINLNLISKKIKSIKEKNIKNEITKYQIQIDVSLNFEEINTNKSGEINIKKTGDYNVAKQYSQTLNNEKKLIDVLLSSITDEITIKLTRGLNDL